MSLQRFSYSPLTAGKHQVGLAGSFSAWQILPLDDYGGVYVLSLELPPGKYTYKFIVDGFWITDAGNALSESDAFGGRNSVLLVNDSQESLSWADILPRLENKKATDFAKFYRSGEEAGELRFWWYQGLAKEVKLLCPHGNYALSRIGGNALQDVFYLLFSADQQHTEPVDESSGSVCTTLPWELLAQSEPQNAKILAFHLAISSSDNLIYLGATGFSTVLENLAPIVINLAETVIFSIPDWVGKGIIYQIFPDRFYNGDAGKNPNFSEWYYQDCNTPPPPGELLAKNREYFHFVQDWKDISGLQQSPYLAEGKPDWWSFYGGDITGVQAKLDYLCSLGVSIIYFNPLWQAKSNHKYDSADYHSIDPHFATTAELIDFVNIAHSRGIKIILDVAFNHTGETFWAFRDCVEKGKDSPYWNWYDWKKWPLPKPLPADFKPKEYYQCWWGIKDMPDLNYDLSRHHPEENAIRNIKSALVNAPLIDYLRETTRWWLLDIGIDGFRLDVPDEVPYWYWELFRKEVKQAKPDAWIVGEIWHDATQWVSERYFDSVMNYAYFKNPVIEFFLFGLISQTEFVRQIETGLALYPFHALKAMMNLLGSHDTLRIYELAKGKLAQLKLTIVFQMCFLGSPHVYYGDEIAMPGGKDPDNRRPFNWDWENDPTAVDLHRFYEKIIHLRLNNPTLTEGAFSFIPNADDLLCFIRQKGKEKLLIAINNCNSSKPLLLPENHKLLFYCGDETIADSTTPAEQLMLKPWSAIVLSL